MTLGRAVIGCKSCTPAISPSHRTNYMDSSSSILVVCCGLYYFSGGRFSLVLAALASYVFFRPKPEKCEKSLRIREVDFTYAYGATQNTPNAGKTQISQQIALKKTRRPRVAKVFKGTRPVSESVLTSTELKLLTCPVYIFYTTLTGTSKRVAESLHKQLGALDGIKHAPKLLSLDDDVDDLEEYFMKTPKNDEPNIYLLVLPSYETDSPIDYFIEHLIDTAQDFRVDKYPLQALAGFAILGLGDSESWPDSKFCYQALSADRWMGKLGGRRLYPVGQVCIKHDGEDKTQDWISGLSAMLADDEPFYMGGDVDDSDAEEEADDVVDVEDMGTIIRKSNKTSNDNANGENFENTPKQMVAQNSPTYRSLTKQGYTIVGSHSGVKICRWTKSAMRGRGSCYKYAFYGIRLHLCMETTPSLACLNKCVFCWRHGTNPVAKLNWRWEVDRPETVLAGALEGHYKKIKQMRGVPGIQMDRFNEAFQVRHCALSLVGEPIFYPHINEFVGMLHERQISSFLVCNAQHPDCLARLGKVTQLYVSIDAPTRQDLKKVDRPLNADFWERLMACLDIIRTVQSHQRTVFRLTLVKGFNMGDVEAYADMVARAQPSQIEVKGATFCGSSLANGNPLTMQNIPFYAESREFVESLAAELQKRGLEYDIAAEHAHSCCILLAHTKFKVNGVWHTHIDYPRFFELLESGEEFCDMDYAKETPAWAVWGSEEAGFSPDDTKWDRKAEKAKKREEREAQMLKVKVDI